MQPAVYTHGHHESVLRSHSWRTAANSAGYLLPHLRANTHVLDVGCGPGTITCDFAELVPGGRVVGIDSAADVLDLARETAAKRSIPNVSFAKGDVFALDFPDATFDVTHAHQVLQHVADPVAALREMRRVTKPGGIVAARDADFSGSTWFPDVTGMASWRDLYLRVARGNGGEPDAGRRLHVWAHAAGFERAAVAATASVWCYSNDRDRAWWSDLWAERTLKSAFARTALEGGHASEAELAAASQAWREWGAQEDGWFAVLCGEVVCTVG